MLLLHFQFFLYVALLILSVEERNIDSCKHFLNFCLYICSLYKILVKCLGRIEHSIIIFLQIVTEYDIKAAMQFLGEINL